MRFLSKLAMWLLRDRPEEYEQIKPRYLLLRENYLEQERIEANQKAHELADEMLNRFHEKHPLTKSYSSITDEEPPKPFDWEAFKLKQERCKHLKGGRVAGGHKYYCVSCFTYINGEQVIKCLICRKEWRRGDTDWNTAVDMLDNSTNTPNSCEVVMVGTQQELKEKIKKLSELRNPLKSTVILTPEKPEPVGEYLEIFASPKSIESKKKTGRKRKKS